MSTTHVDRHGERMSKNALEGMADQINSKYIPYLIEHDWDKHVGTVFYGEVFRLKDGEYALGVVVGLFEVESEFENFKKGNKNTIWSDCKKYLDPKELALTLDDKTNTKDNTRDELIAPRLKRSVADLLEVHLDSTQVLPDGTVYKIKRFIAAAGDLRMELHPKDHPPAHFHVISKQRNIDARFDINTLEFDSMKKGKISNGDIKKIQSFFRYYPEMLIRLKEEYARLK
jgi:hypothetical protein